MDSVAHLGAAFTALIRRIEALETRQQEMSERLAALEADARQGRRSWRVK